MKLLAKRLADAGTDMELVIQIDSYAELAGWQLLLLVAATQRTKADEPARIELDEDGLPIVCMGVQAAELLYRAMKSKHGAFRGAFAGFMPGHACEICARRVFGKLESLAESGHTTVADERFVSRGEPVPSVNSMPRTLKRLKTGMDRRPVR